MRFAYIKNNGYLCIEIFETMQSSVTRSRTSITKSLPASLKYYSKLLYHRKLKQNTKFYAEKPRVSCFETDSFTPRNKSFDKGFQFLSRISLYLCNIRINQSINY